jgi:hypothetical protein
VIVNAEVVEFGSGCQKWIMIFKKCHFLPQIGKTAENSDHCFDPRFFPPTVRLAWQEVLVADGEGVRPLTDASSNELKNQVEKNKFSQIQAGVNVMIFKIAPNPSQKIQNVNAVNR